MQKWTKTWYNDDLTRENLENSFQTHTSGVVKSVFQFNRKKESCVVSSNAQQRELWRHFSHATLLLKCSSLQPPAGGASERLPRTVRNGSRAAKTARASPSRRRCTSHVHPAGRRAMTRARTWARMRRCCASAGWPLQPSSAGGARAPACR